MWYNKIYLRYLAVGLSMLALIHNIYLLLNGICAALGVQLTFFISQQAFRIAGFMAYVWIAINLILFISHGFLMSAAIKDRLSIILILKYVGFGILFMTIAAIVLDIVFSKGPLKYIMDGNYVVSIAIDGLTTLVLYYTYRDQYEEEYSKKDITNKGKESTTSAPLQAKSQENIEDLKEVEEDVGNNVPFLYSL